MDEAEQVHHALLSVAERLASVLDGARVERRDGYTFMAFPTLPIRAINGLWAETDAAASALEGALRESEEVGTPFSVRVRAGRTDAVADAARELGLTAEERIPAMALRRDELQTPPGPELQIIRVETADGLAQALAVAATGFGTPLEIIAPMYGLEVADLDGFHYYLARAGRRDVSTAAAFQVDGTVGIFNVATPPEYRRRGYGATVTAHAVQEGFARGADLAFLESSLMGESVYRGLGFREVLTYTQFARPKVSPTS